MEKQIFKTGDKVFDIRFGWGEVEEISNENNPVKVKFNKITIRYLKEGRVNEFEEVRLLSFTEYTLQGFSQERPINYKDYIGKWGKFYESENKNEYIIGKMENFLTNYKEYPFVVKNFDVYYKYFEPLTEEQIKILGLEQ